MILVVSGFILAKSDVQISNSPDWLETEPGSIRQIGFDKNQRRIISAGYDGTARITNAATGQIITTLQGHEAKEILSAEFSPNGNLAVTTSFLDFTVRVWNTISGDQTQVFKFDWNVRYATFSNDGLFIAIAGDFETIQFFDIQSKKKRFSIPIEDVATLIKFSPDGTKLLVATRSKGLYLFDFKSRKLIKKFVGHTEDVTSAYFSSDGKLISTASYDKSAGIWNAQTGKPVRFFKGFKNYVNDAVFSPDTTKIAIATFYVMHIMNVKSGKELKRINTTSMGCHSPIFTKNGQQLVAACSDGYVRFWDTRTGKEIRGFPVHSAEIGSVVINHSATKFSATTIDGKGSVRGLDGKPIFELGIGNESIWVGDFSSDDKKFVTSGDSPDIKIWDSGTGGLIGSLGGHLKNEGQNPLNFSIPLAIFSPDNKQIATTSPDGIIRLWDVDSQELRLELKDKKELIRKLKFSPDGQYLVSQSNNNARIWNVKTGKKLLTLPKQINDTPILFNSTSNKAMIFYGIFDLKTGKWERLEKREPQQPKNEVPLMVVDGYIEQDGKFFNLIFNSGSVGVWDFEGRLIRKTNLIGHTDNIWFAVFAPRKNLFATGSPDGTVRVWDANNGNELQRFTNHAGGVSALAITSDDQYIISGAGNGLRRWTIKAK